MSRNKILGVMGGIASGKSHVSRLAAGLGRGQLLVADALAHEALDEIAADGSLDEAFGEGFVKDGKVDRESLAVHVFGEDVMPLLILEALIHPIVSNKIVDRLVDGFVVLDAPLLVEKKLHLLCHELWFVDVSSDTREKRAVARGITLAEVTRREKRQTSLAEKRELASFIINNDTDPTEQIKTGLVRLGILPLQT